MNDCNGHKPRITLIDGDESCLTCWQKDRFTESVYPRRPDTWEPRPLVTSGEYLRRIAYWRKARGDNVDDEEPT